ncbi:5-aminolevulinate synthase [Platysternon megacephalum]|uniref:5-aminolevulinate synthase n=1 Tax=Platysternon megacephalum TaxID=55544 RepID=A0A4D9DED8_9SAUR|nr:5-aminolevulinate synthase [Platysternon megacephalum]
MSAEGGTRAVVAALFANLGIAITKFVAYFLTLSSSMLAEAVHSLADSGNQLLLLWGGKAAKRAPTAKHQFGFGSERYLYGFVVSIVLFTVGGLFALYEASHKWSHPEPIVGQWWWVPLAVLIVAIGLESRSFAVAIKESNQVRQGRSWGEFIRGSKSPELPVILLEDAAALCGLVFALFGVSLTLLTGDGRWDAVGTALIGVLLVLVAAVLAVEMKSLLIGESADPLVQENIERAIVGDASSNVERLIFTRTLHIGPDELLVAAKFAMKQAHSAQDVADTINAAEQRARAAAGAMHLVIFLEPDVYHPSVTKTPPGR